MSIFNQANDLAYLAVYGKSYLDSPDDPFRGRPDGVTEKDGVLHGTLKEEGFELDLTGRPVSHETWADVAQEFQHYFARQIFWDNGMPPTSKGASSFMATKTHIVIFKEAMDRNAQPEIFTCSAAESDEVQALLATVENEGDGPIGNLSDTEFVEQVAPITLAELRERFAEELEAAELAAAEQEEA